jgi:hypothetical protein
MPILGERRVVRHLAIEPKPTDPAIGEVQVNLLAQPPFRANAKAVANKQHPDEPFGINRGPASRAVKRRQMAPDLRQSDQSTSASGRPEHVAQVRTRTSLGPSAIGRPHLEDDDDRSLGEGIRRLCHQLPAGRRCRGCQARSPALGLRRVPRTQAARELRTGSISTLHGVVFEILNRPEPTLICRVLPA